MKNLMIFVSPTGSFDNPRHDLTDNDAAPLAKLQIENSLRLGWDRQDMMLVTNFDFEYQGVKALALPDISFLDHKPQASKICAIVKLFEHGHIEKNELYWFHDLDAFQLQIIEEDEIEIADDEIAATDFGGAKHFRGEDRWSGGIFYFKHKSLDLFERIERLVREKRIDEEEALGILVTQDPSVRKRIVKLNSSYNFIGYNLKNEYEKSMKPLKVVHFHPRKPKKRLENKNGLLFFLGDNILQKKLITDEVVQLLKQHQLA